MPVCDWPLFYNDLATAQAAARDFGWTFDELMARLCNSRFPGGWTPGWTPTGLMPAAPAALAVPTLPAAPALAVPTVPTTPTVPRLPFTARVFLDGPVATALPPLSTELQLGQRLDMPISYQVPSYVTPGDYQVRLVVKTGTRELFNRVIAPLKVKAPVAPGVPPVAAPPVPAVPTAPPAPAVPAFPSVPRADMIDVPSVPTDQVTQGDRWERSLSIPTVIPTDLQPPPGVSLPTYPFNLYMELQDPAGKAFTLATVTKSAQLGQPLSIPFSLDTSNVAPGTSNLMLEITSLGQPVLPLRKIGALQVLAKALPPAPPPPPPVPVAPTFGALPTSNMIGAPLFSFPSSLTQGDSLTGSVTIPTVIPSGMPQVGLPTYPYTIILELHAPDGKTYPISVNTYNLRLSEAINIPVIWNTSGVPTGTSQLWALVIDSAGNQLFWNKITDIMINAPVPAAPAYSYSSEELNTAFDNLETLYFQGQIDYATYSDLYNRWLEAYYGRGPLPTIPATLASIQ